MAVKTTFEETEASVNSLETVRENILDTLLIAITFMAIAPLVASLYRSVNIGWQITMYLQLIVYLIFFITTLFRRKILFFHKALIVISLCFLIGGTIIINMGLIGSGDIFMLFSIILATMFLGVRYGGILILASLVVLITAALGVNQGWIIFDFNIETASLVLSSWISGIFAFVFFTVILIFSLGRFINYLVGSSNILRKHSLELKRTNEKVLEEIEEKKRAEDDLKKSEEKYRILYENATDGICVAQDEVIKFPNPKMEEITGYSKEELIQKPFNDFIHPEDRGMVLDRHKRRLAGEEPPPTYSFRIINKKGEVLWVQVNTVMIEWEGHPASLNFLRDITQIKELEEQLIQAQRMEAIGTLAGGIAHDFNNILSPIMAYSEMAAMNLPPESPIKQNLQQIYRAGERARDLVKQILTFARKSEKQRIPLKISQIVKETVKFLRSTIPSTINIQYDCKTKDDTVLADPTQMNQIVMNLCTNAAYAMREKGGILEVILEDEHLGTDDISQFDGLIPGHYLRLSVRDTGPGISPDIMNKIYEPYFTTKGVGEGTGLGLAVVHGIIRNYGGNITVDSVVGMGTTFHVLIPIFEAEIPIATAAKLELPRGKEHILFVDDEKQIVDMVRLMLENLGYQVTVRTSSVEALEAFRNKPDKYDMVITDMTMPNMTGKDLAKELMNERPDIPIILCTGFSEQIDERRAKELGMSAFIMKPIVMHDIANTIRRIFDKKPKHSE